MRVLNPLVPRGPPDAEDLVARAKGTEDVAQLNKVVQEGHEQRIHLFHYAAATGDREFFGIMMPFLPLETLTKELQTPNQNGMTPIDCARSTHPSLVTSIEAFLLSRGFDSNCSSQSLSVYSVAPYQVPGGVGEDETYSSLKRVEVSSSRFLVCLKSASTVGETLRANGIYYAAARAVYVRHVRSDKLDELARHGDNLLEFPDSDETPNFLWTGTRIAELANDDRFRAAFKIFAPCTSASQQLTPGMSVLLDLENLSSTPSAEEKLIIVRYLPSPGTMDTTTSNHPHVCISDAGVRVHDKGYFDDIYLTGFRRGWYDGVDYRTVGNYPNVFLSGGNAGDPKKFNIWEEDDFGFDNRRVMVKLPDEGIVYCRGVGDNRKNPEMACVLFDSEGNIRERYGYRGKLGRWNDFFQLFQ